MRWTWGDAAIPTGVAVAVLLQALVILALVSGAWDLRRIAGVVAIILILGWAVEALGSRTGVPFGAYDYTARLQPQLAGVPIVVPLAWLMMLPPSWAVARLLAGRYGSLVFVLSSATAFTAWDLLLDPQMVAWGFWTWAQPGAYLASPGSTIWDGLSPPLS